MVLAAKERGMGTTKILSTRAEMNWEVKCGQKMEGSSKKRKE